MKKINCEVEITRLKGELSEKNKQIKSLSQNLKKTKADAAKKLEKTKENSAKELLKTKEKSKEKIAKLQKELKKKRRTEKNLQQRTTTITFEPIKGYGYSELIVRLATLLYTRLNCGLRSVVIAMEVFNEVLFEILGELPCHTTIGIWMKKCGLQVYQTAGESVHDTDYALVTDESMMIGSEKLLLTLAVPAEHQGQPLSCEDVSVVGIAVDKSWNGENIGLQLRKASKKVGHLPGFVITDNASIMNKGVRCAGMIHHHDISHSLAMYLERAYGKEFDFKEYVKLMTGSKFKYNMTKIAYLLPPTQRTIARFMNLSHWVKWSSRILDKYDTLNMDEQKAFSFIPESAGIIDELSIVIQCVERIEHLCKHKGLSKETVCKCEKSIQTNLLGGNSRMISVGENFSEFLRKEIMLFEEDTVSRNNSSDIIESIFGKYKAIKSPNKLNGVTTSVLYLPIYTKLANKAKAKDFNFKKALEDTRIGHIDDWAKNNLTPNLVQLRRKRLQKTG